MLILGPWAQPCNRLGHPCDYSPRLSFKDETPRVVEKMQGVTRTGDNSKSVWDRMSTSVSVGWIVLTR